MMEPATETEAERTARIVEGANRSIDSIRSFYQRHQMTPQQRKEVESGDGGLLADIEEKYRQGKVTLEALQSFKASMASIQKFKEDIPLKHYEDEPEKTAEWSFNHSEYGQITITDEGAKHWRQANVNDVGSIVLIHDYMHDHPLFGEFDDTEEGPDEEFPDESHTVAFVHLQNGEQYQSGYAHGGGFEEMQVVPEMVLRGVRNEAPPGSFFSGISTRNTNAWSPAPEGKVWYHPAVLSLPPQYFSDAEYFSLKRMCEKCPGFPVDVSREQRLYEEWGRFEYWCPIQRKFMCEGEMRRQEHWFRNGDGSAQQRRYYNQNEMLDRYGGLTTLPLGYESSGAARTCASDDVKVASVRTADQAIAERFKKAAESGSTIDLS